jgi:hypothetical protein
MFNFEGGSGFQGTGYVVLNAIRALNLVVLTALAISCVLMMVFAKMPNAFQFFTDINLFFIFCVCCLLAWTELPFKFGKAWIHHTWPVFSEGHGFIWFGTAIFLMGCHTLGALSNEPYTQEIIGDHVWRVVAASGCLGIAFGTINIVASLLYSNNEVDAREIRRTGATTRTTNWGDDYLSNRSNSVRKEKGLSRWVPNFSKDNKPRISPPIAHDVEQAHNDCPPSDRSSPIIPNMQRPPTALHPMHQQMHYGTASSRYSEVSHIDRFGVDKI